MLAAACFPTIHALTTADPALAGLAALASPCDDATMRGDRVEVVIDVGEGTRTYEISATRAGRRVDVSSVRGVVEVSEVTRSGAVVRSGRFMASRVVAVIEYPAEDGEVSGRKPNPPSDQASLL